MYYHTISDCLATCSNWIVFPPPTTNLLVYDFAVDDLNNDGIPDLVIGHERGVLAWASDGTGAWR